MPSNIECPCGHTVRVPDDMLNTRVKCPVCGELLSSTSATYSVDPVDESETSGSIADDGADSAQYETPFEQEKPETPQPSAGQGPFRLNGAGAFLFLGLPMPAGFTDSSLILLPERVRLKSSGLLTNRRADLRLSEISSVETRRCPAWYLLLLGLLTVAQGIGLIFLIAFVFVRHSYLILKCSQMTIAIRFSGDDSDACAVGDAILQAASLKPSTR